jgi:membrane protease YdiL (CAAX protease family)
MRYALSAADALLLAVGATLAFVLLVRLGGRIVAFITPVSEQPSSRQLASRHILGSALGQALSVTLVAALLLRAGLSLGDIGLTRAASIQVWGAALLLALLVAALMIAGPLRASATLREWSAYRVSGGLLAGVAAGFGEETVFRGFVMSALAWGGLGSSVQVVASAALFGLAHMGWGSLGRRAAVRAALGAALPTAVIGALYGLLYIWGGRSLVPLIVSHGLTDVIIEPALLEAMISRSAASGRPGS